ncbi:MAG: hypothetical protein ACNS60_07760 [Candidatus Cyclobacteriaceae bacterium M2_1C_046]
MNVNLDKKRIEREFEFFTSKNFEKPKKCRNTEQIRFYVQELTLMIQKMESRSGYIPPSAYQLLAQYNQELNKHIYADFRNHYC